MHTFCFEALFMLLLREGAAFYALTRTPSTMRDEGNLAIDLQRLFWPGGWELHYAFEGITPWDGQHAS